MYGGYINIYRIFIEQIAGGNDGDFIRDRTRGTRGERI